MSLGDSRKPAGTRTLVSMRGFINANTGIRAGGAVCVYRFDDNGNLTLEGSTRVSNSGVITFRNGGRGDYVFLGEKI